MKILFIGLTENSLMRGVERYCVELLKQLQENKEIKVTLLLGDWQKYYDVLDKTKIDFLYYNGKNNKIARHIFLITQIKKISINYDLIHYGNTMPYIFKNYSPTIMTIHDIAEYFVPEKYSFLQLLYRKAIVKRASILAGAIITDSNFSKNSIINKLNINRNKISVIYLGIEHFLKEKIFLDKHNDSNNYILYWSVLENSKGIVELVKSFIVASEHLNDTELHIVGKKGNAWNKIEADINKNKKIKYFGYLNDADLQKKIASATMVVFPSKYEGFGFPALEAFLLNDNVITSSTTSLGEISKDFAIQINPESIENISQKIISIYNNPHNYTFDDRKEILKKFSWEECALKTINIYKEFKK